MNILNVEEMIRVKLNSSSKKISTDGQRNSLQKEEKRKIKSPSKQHIFFSFIPSYMTGKLKTYQ